jgi:hypothetical protein
VYRASRINSPFNLDELLGTPDKEHVPILINIPNITGLEVAIDNRRTGLEAEVPT